MWCPTHRHQQCTAGWRCAPEALRPTDRDHLAAAFTRLSATTRADRFLTGMPRLPTMMLDKLIDDVDGHRHVALVLIATPPGAPQVPIAVGRFVRAGPWDCSGR